MAKYTYINGSLGALFNALSDANENGDYFDSIERVSPQYDWQGFNCIINGNTVFHIEKYSNVTTTIKVYGITPSFTSGTAGIFAPWWIILSTTSWQPILKSILPLPS